MQIKHEWRKKEKRFYLPKNKPEFITIPEYQFIVLSGEGNPNSAFFTECIGALYSVAYAIKMTLKKIENKPSEYTDWTVYPLEGVWDISEKAKQEFNGQIDKDELVFDLMIRQPDFVDRKLFEEMLELAKAKNPNPLFDKIRLEKKTEGRCIQMLHIGSYDNEAQSFKQMEEYADTLEWNRQSKIHREIYLSDFRKVPTEKLKTVLRFQLEE